MNKHRQNIYILIWSLFVLIALKQESFRQSLCNRVGISNGWMLHMNDNEVNQITAACSATSALYFRTDFAWSDVQWNGDDEWNWSNIDRVLQSALSQDLELIAILDYFPPWANIETDTSYWFNYVYQAGLRYIPQGVAIWEMWNEPNLQNFFPDPNVEDYVKRILKPGANAIRKAAKELNAQVTVLTGGLAPAASDGTNISQLDFVTEMYHYDAQNYFDGLGQHPYCWPLDPSILDDFNWFLKTQELYNVMQANGDGHKLIWGTELGWPTHDANQNGVTIFDQAIYLTKAYDIWNAWNWTGPLIWYAYNDAGTDLNNPEDHFGLTDHQFNAKPSLDSFIVVTNECAGNLSTKLHYTDQLTGIHLFPNPVKDQFTINGLPLFNTIKIIDINGNVYHNYINASRSLSVNIQDLPSGIYFILIEQEGNNQTNFKKILKE